MRHRVTASVLAVAAVLGASSCLPVVVKPPVKPKPVVVKPVAPAKPVWAEEFSAPLTLASDSRPATWRARGADDGGTLAEGWQDYISDTWNVSPIQTPELNPISVAGGVMSLTARRNPGTAVTELPWLSGMLSTDPRKQTFTRGYFEWRMRVPVQSTGMLPALWLYASPQAAADHQLDEIDVTEIFGDREGMPWLTAIHGKGRRYVSPARDEDTAGWHTYAVDWQRDWIRFYRDGKQVVAYGADVAAWYRGTPMDLRISLGVNPWFISRPAVENQLLLQVDYVRVWKVKP